MTTESRARDIFEPYKKKEGPSDKISITKQIQYCRPHMNFMPINLNLGNRNPNGLCQNQNLQIKDPPFDVHVGENQFGRFPREEFEAALGIFDVADAKEVDVEVEAAHEEISDRGALPRRME